MHPIIWLLGAAGGFFALKQVQKKAKQKKTEALGDYPTGQSPVAQLVSKTDFLVVGDPELVAQQEEALDKTKVILQ